ncbi:hypothetical protein ACVQ8P_03980 [Dellaglioa sp. BT-FLS60]
MNDLLKKNESKITNGKKFVKGHKKSLSIGASILIILIIIFSFIATRPTNLVSTADVTFSGYDGDGTLNYKSDALDKKIKEISYKAAKISEKDTKILLSDNTSAIDILETDPAFEQKEDLADSYDSAVDVDFNKESNLSNGDKVTMTVTVDSTDIPIKSTKKTFTVKGLKKSAKITISDILKNVSFNFSGYNGSGSIHEKSAKYGSDILSMPVNKYNLSNGDTVKVKINPDYIDSLGGKGKIFTGSHSKKVTVTGLKSLSNIENLAAALTQVDALAKTDNKDDKDSPDIGTDTFIIKRLTSYITNIRSTSFVTSVTHSSYRLAVIYKINENNTFTDDNQKTTSYKIYGYDSIDISNNKLDLKNVSSNDTLSLSNQAYTSLDAATSALKSANSGYTKVTVEK